MNSRVIHSARKVDAAGHVDDAWVASDDGIITATGTGTTWRAHVADPDAEIVDAHGHWLTPGFIDLHGHGGGGFSYDGGLDELLGALAMHRTHGTTRSVISLVADPVPALSESLAIIADLTESDPLVLGAHLEGPFLSPDRRGAHNPDYLRDPDPETVEQLIGAARGTLRQITIAPELPNAFESIDVLVDAGVVVAVGHTEATEELALKAFDRGARLLTHVFNAMPGIGHRAPGPVIAGFEDDRVTLELILDGIHVHPDVATVAFTQAPGRIALITDAMAAAGSTDGDYQLGSLHVVVTDGVARLAETNSIAGSTLTQDVALRIAVERVGLDPAVAVEALTRTPARVLGRDHELGMLAPGFADDAVLLDGAWAVRGVWGAGQRIV